MEWTQRCEWAFDYWTETRPLTSKSGSPLLSNAGSPLPHDTNAKRTRHGIQLLTDTAVRPTSTRAGYGAIIQDADGIMCGAMAFVDPTSHNPLAAEIHALIHGLRLLQRMHITSACVFSDFDTAIKLIRGDIQITSEVYHWIIHIHELTSSFEAINFAYVSRQSNRKADYLAKYSLQHRSSRLWLQDFPQELLSMSNQPCSLQL